MRYQRYTLAGLLAVGMVASFTGAAAADPGPHHGDGRHGKTPPIVTTTECPDLPDLPKLPGKAAVKVEVKDGMIVVNGRKVGPAEGKGSGERSVVAMKDGKIYTGEEAEKIAGELPPGEHAVAIAEKGSQEGDGPATERSIVVMKDGKIYTGEEAEKIAGELPPLPAKPGVTVPGKGAGPERVCVIAKAGGASKASEATPSASR